MANNVTGLVRGTRSLAGTARTVRPKPNINSIDFGTVVVRMLACAQCGSFMLEQNALNWIHTSVAGPRGQTFDEYAIEGDFCSEECVVRYFKRGAKLRGR